MNLRVLFALLGGCALSPAIVLAQAFDCETTADCPLALECETTRVVESCPTSPGEAGDGAPPPDAGCSTEEEPIEEPSCVFATQTCTETAECAGDLVCQALGRVGECMSNGGGEPICTEHEVRYCFPARQDCESTSECAEGFRCTMLPEEALDDPPTGWEGAAKICVPEGIALVLEGRVELSATSEIRSSSSEDRAQGSSGRGAANAPSDESSANGCSVREAHSRQPHAARALILLALGALWRAGRRPRSDRRSR